jgi:hypothetical protein
MQENAHVVRDELKQLAHSAGWVPQAVRQALSLHEHLPMQAA